MWKNALNIFTHLSNNLLTLSLYTHWSPSVHHFRQQCIKLMDGLACEMQLGMSLIIIGIAFVCVILPCSKFAKSLHQNFESKLNLIKALSTSSLFGWCVEWFNIEILNLFCLLSRSQKPPKAIQETRNNGKYLHRQEAKWYYLLW